LKVHFARPLAVLEQEIDQLGQLYPGKFLQFTDDNLLMNRRYRAELLALLRQKKRRFVTMVTVDQFCDGALMEEMAASGCLGVAVGVESADDDNCAAVSKYQNLQQPFVDAVHHANKLGIQTCALIMLGLPHDTPQRLASALAYLKGIPCSLFDLRIMRIYPSTPLYEQLQAAGDVTKDWWLARESSLNCNHLLPSCWSMDFRHPNFEPMQLQRVTLQFMAELNKLTPRSLAHVTGIGWRGRGLGTAALLLTARQRSVSQARMLLRQVDEAIAARSRGRSPGIQVASCP